jgi:phage replication-related protein YjqB (UPF0714/DUF867 family)
VDTTSQQPQRMTPLWVISLFVSLTEVVTGIAVTKATGGVQVALTIFVIAFPMLVALGFFLILWFRPYVLYPPTEFSGGTDVAAYVRAMRSDAQALLADVDADLAGLHARIALEAEVVGGRLEALEDGIRKLLSAPGDGHPLLQSLDAERAGRMATAIAKKTSFEENSQYEIVVVDVGAQVTFVDERGARVTGLQRDKAPELAKQLAEIGFRTSVTRWNRDYFLSGLEDTHDTIYVVYRDEKTAHVRRLESALRDLTPTTPTKTIIFGEAMAASRPSVKESLNKFSTTVAYRHAG